MNTRTPTRRAVSFAVLLVLCVAPAIKSAAAAEDSAGTVDKSSDMVSALRAGSPSVALGDHAKVIGRLIGSWDVDYADFKKDGTTQHRTGRLLFGWVVDGLVIQDVWIVDAYGSHKDREVYTELFYFDPKTAGWKVAAVDPYEASVANFTGYAAGDDRFAVESRDLTPNETHRWSYNDIQADSAVFRDEVSADGGKTWRLTGEYHMKRRAN
jgi:hypothetical protein